MNSAQKIVLELVVLLLAISSLGIAESVPNPIYDTFTSYHTSDGQLHFGEYSLYYIFRNYNAFTSEDCTVSHMVGPAVVGGEFSGSLGGVTVGAIDSLPHEVPSYVSTTSVSKDILYFSDSLYFYTDSGNSTAYRVWGKDHSIRDDAVVHANAFIADNAMDLLQSEIESQRDEEMIHVTNPQATLENDHYAFERPYGSKKQLTVQSGHRYNVTGVKADMINIIDGSTQSDILFFSDDSTVQMPIVMFNGQEAGSIEHGLNTGVVFMAPNASQFIGPDHGHTGHIAAPNAVVQVNAGDFNGCIIAKRITGNRFGNKKGEGHMWPYHGELIRHKPKAAQVHFSVDKLLDSKPCGLNIFQFLLTDERGNVLQSIQNHDGTVYFEPISFSEEGVFTFYLAEVDGQSRQVLYDDAVYKVTVKVTCPKNYLAEISIEKNGRPYQGTPIFQNITVKDPPPTGDPTNLRRLAVLICIAFIPPVLLCLKRHKTRC